LKQDLKVWNKKVFENVDKGKHEIIRKISFLDKGDNENNLDDKGKNERKELTIELNKLSLREEALMYQKVITKWIKKIDLNTKYFRRVMT